MRSWRSNAFWLATAAAVSASPARANGRFPTATVAVFDPADEKHFAVAATFGLLESRDAGASFRWVCEFAMHLSGEQDAMFAITASGALVGATFDGITRSIDGCTFDKPADLDGEIVGDLSLSRSEPDTVFGFRTIGIGASRFDSQIVRSEDAGATWTRLDPPLPETLLPLTIDVAPGDPERLYLSARLGGEDEFQSVLLRSNDGGLSFVTSVIPDTSGQRLAFISAVDPNDPDVLYVRVDDPDGTVLWRSTDGGSSFERLFTASGRLVAFARSPDGTRLALGGPADGIWMGNADGSDLARRSDIAPSCLAWSEHGLYACADVAIDGFSIGRAQPDASAEGEPLSFEPLLRFADLCGNTGCGDGSATEAECAADWQLAVGPQLSATCGVPEPGTAGSGGAAGAAGGEEPPVDASEDGGCALSARPALGGATALGTLALVLTTVRRRKRRGEA